MLSSFANCNDGNHSFGRPQISTDRTIPARLFRLFRSSTLYVVLFLLASPVSAGNIVLTGHDDDFHSFFHSGSNALAQAQAIIAFVRSGAPNPSLPVLAFDHGHQLTSLLASLGIPFSNIDPDAGVPAASLFDVTRFSAIVVASDLTCGGCDNTPTSSANLNAAAPAIAAFFSAGGGIVGFAGAANSSYYRFVPASASGFGEPPSNGYVQTALGAALGIPAVNGDPTHNFFFTPGTNGVSAAYGVVETLGVGGQIETIACQGCGAAEIGTFFSFLGTPGSTTNPTASFAEPVNTAIGNYYTSRNDLIEPGKGFAFRFTRFYNSRDPYSGPLGAGWTHSYNLLLRVDSVTGSVGVKQEDGSTMVFSRAPSGTYSPSTIGLFDQLQKNSDGSFSLTKKNQTKLTFASTGRLATITDRNGNSQNLSYDSGGNLISVTDTAGRIFSFAYDALKRITSISDPSGRVVSYGYDGNGNLVSYFDPLGNSTQYEYDAGHHLVSATDPRNVKYLQNVYDPQGRVLTQTNARGFVTRFEYNSPTAGSTKITDGRGNQTIHGYDSVLRIVKIMDAVGNTIAYTYDANNDRTSVTNQNGKKTSFSYDIRGNTSGIADPLGNVAAFSYDEKNNLLTATNAKAETTSMSYDGNGNLIRIQDALGNATRFAYDGFGELASRTDGRGNSTNYSHDALGNLTQITDALGHQITLNYDALGRLVSITDPNGHTATATYDVLSRLVKITDPLSNQTQFAYDAIGSILKITDANGNATSYAYDATNNLVSVTDALGHVTLYSYDENQNRVAFTNANGNATSYAYDALNRLSQITDPLALTTRYSYDPVGNTLAITDAKGQNNQFIYDALNRLAGISYADGKSVAYFYDANGNRTSMVDAHGTTTYAYDALDRLTSVTNPGGKVVTHGYDAVGNRDLLTYPDGKVVSYSYDPANRLSSVRDWLNRTTDYSYDAASNLIGTMYPNQARMEYSYDVAGRLSEVRNSYRGSSDVPANPVTSFTYVLDPVGNRLRATDGSGKSTSYGYDGLNELTSVAVDTKLTHVSYDAVGNRSHLTAPGTSISYSYDADDRLLTAGTATFTYDANGNQISKTQTATGQPFIFAYDASNRLTSAAGGVMSSTFAYDGDGNRISQSVTTGRYDYLNDVAVALPIVLQESGPDGNISYAYGIGRIFESSGAFDYFYHYDGLGSVVGLTGPTGKLAGRYLYDAWGRLDLSAPNPQLGTKNKFQFTGEALDPATQLCYFRARYYDPTVGRFTKPDPQSASVFDPRQNRFNYAFSNPIRFTDPSGLSGVDSNRLTQLASLSSVVQDNLGSIENSLLKLFSQAGTLFSLGQLKSGIEEIQQTKATQLDQFASQALTFLELGFGLKDALGMAVHDYIPPSPQDFAKLKAMVIQEAKQAGIPDSQLQ